MSNADDTNSSLGSDTGASEKEQRLRLRQMILEQQQHLLSQYQNKKNSTSTSGDNGK